ncbi:MAG: hypothetical protein KGQ62_00715 [Gammaproteobacteria bacterium]|nr:hypothetical protein [Gammaproteobacteria bacterium]MBU6508768.1 hypothetical protein [Gammaproteobacteria bacterium]MDE1983074.1 hypothetical protein [Gammaproteobacteria bacterium]
MPAAYIRGTGLSCTLGLDAEACVTAMRSGKASPEQLIVDGFAEPLRLPYYRIPDGAGSFDPARFQALLQQVVRQVLARAGLSSAERRTLPVFVGSSCFSIGSSEAGYTQALVRDARNAIPMPFCGYQGIASAVQHALGSRGDTYNYNTACTSSANALLAALRMLAVGEYPQALVVGAELANRTTLAGFHGLQLTAERVQPFDARRQGLVLGEGVGAVLLSAQPGSTGELRLLGGANNCDGWSVVTANPDGKSVAAVLRASLDNAGLHAAQVCGIKAHGTATPAGDTAEALGLRQVFEELPPLSVLKPYLGHTLGACGVNELVLYAGALQQGFLPATPGFEVPDPQLEVHPLRTEASAEPGHYLLNHFGFGGNNTVLVLEKPA